MRQFLILYRIGARRWVELNVCVIAFFSASTATITSTINRKLHEILTFPTSFARILHNDHEIPKCSLNNFLEEISPFPFTILYRLNNDSKLCNCFNLYDYFLIEISDPNTLNYHVKIDDNKSNFLNET